MLWLLTQVWVWVVVAFLLGVLVGLLFWARPVRRRVAELDKDQHADHTAVHPAAS